MRVQNHRLTTYSAVVSLALAVLMSFPSLARTVEVPDQYRPLIYRKSVDHTTDLPQQFVDHLRSLIDREDIGCAFALVAGIDNYPSFPLGERALPPAGRDVDMLFTYLRDIERFDEIVVLRNENVNSDAFSFFLETYFPTRLQDCTGSRFLFAYSGHGVNEGDRGYILTQRSTDPGKASGSIGVNTLAAMLERPIDHAHQTLVLINSCYSGRFDRWSFGGAIELPKDIKPKHRGAHVIMAGGSNERAWAAGANTGSVFFESLLAGLNGDADVYPKVGNHRGDGIVTAGELSAFLAGQIQFFSKQEQNPRGRDILRRGSTGAFYFLNRRHFVDKGLIFPWDPARLAGWPPTGGETFGPKTSKPEDLPIEKAKN